MWSKEMKEAVFNKFQICVFIALFDLELKLISRL